MPNHDELSGRDLHEPSNELVLNNRTEFIPIRSFVPLDSLKNADNQRPVTSLATTGTIPVGYVYRAIATGDYDSVLTFGTIEPYDTSSFTKGDLLQVTTDGLGLEVATDRNDAVGIVAVSSTVGSIRFDGLYGVTRGGTGVTYTFEDEGTDVPNQINVSNINFTGAGVTAALASMDDTTLDITVPGGAANITCNTTGGVNNISRIWNGTSSNFRYYNQTNTGFTWVLGKEAASLTITCDGITTDNLPTQGTIAGDIALTGLTLNGTAITATSAVYNSTTQRMTIQYNTAITNPTWTMISNNVFTIAAMFTIGTGSTEYTSSITLDYRPPAFSHSIIGSPSSASFNSTIGSGVVSHGLANGTAFGTLDSATFNSVDIISSLTFGSGGTISISPAVNHNTANSALQLAEAATFTDATNSSNTRTITPGSATLSRSFYYEVYLGSLTTSEATAINITTALLNNTSRFSRVGTFTSTPPDQTFTWTDPMADTQSVKVIAVATRFTNGADIITRAGPGLFPSTSSRLLQRAVGDISTATENYDVYIAATDSPGALSLYVEL